MTITPDSLRRDLSDAAAASAKSERAGGEIRKAAEERDAVIQKRLLELIGKTFDDQEACDEYQALIRERGELAMVLARD